MRLINVGQTCYICLIFLLSQLIIRAEGGIAMDHNISAAPKSEIYHFRINPEVKRQVEEVYAKNGLSFTQAINVFIQQSLNAGGFPFLVSSDNAELLKAAALKKLMGELEQGKQSGDFISNETAIEMLDVDKL